MLPIVSFRDQPFGLLPVCTAGRFLGRRLYWKLFAVENTVRAIIFTILNIELGPNWWIIVTNRRLRDKVDYIKNDYHGRPVHNQPGPHDIYYIFLSDLTKIIFENSEQFRPYIPDIDDLVVQLENIRLPRNLVSHMNWPNLADLNFIEGTYQNLRRLVRLLEARGIVIQIPT